MRKRQNFWHSLYWAGVGIWQAIKSERNFKIHLFAAVLALTLGFLLKITLWEWLVLLLIIGGILAAELFNTALERACDILRDDLGFDTGIPRNLAAGAVLVLASTALIIGCLIFGSRLLALFSS